MQRFERTSILRCRYVVCLVRSSDEIVKFGYTFVLLSIVSRDKAYKIIFTYIEANGVVCDVQAEYLHIMQILIRRLSTKALIKY